MVILTALAAPAVANAAEQPVQLSAKPIGQPGQYFDLILAPGQTQDFTIALGNHGTKPIVARTYAADAYTIINGGFAAELRDGTATGTTTWLEYPTRVLTLQPDRATLQTFSVTVPKDTPPGEYIAAVILENDAPITGTGSVALDQIVRQAVAVAVRVPGPLTAGLAIAAASHKLAAERSVIAVDVSNTGTMRLTPGAKIVLHDDTGKIVSRATVPMDSFYAGTDTKVEITLASALQPGSYSVDLTLDDNQRDAHAAAVGLPLTVLAPVAAPDAKPSVGRQVIDVLQAKPGHFPIWAALLTALGIALAGTALAVAHRRRARSLRYPATHRRQGGS